MTPLSYTVLFAATGTSNTNTVLITENGFVQNIVIDATNIPVGRTVTVKVTDYDGYDLFNSGAVAGGAVSTWGGYTAPEIGSLPLDYNYTVTATVDVALGGSGGSAKVKFYCKSMGVGE